MSNAHTGVRDAGTHPCPAPDCRVKHLSHDRLMCLAHWRTVPGALRSAVYREWNDGRPTVRYLRARRDAIDAIGKG